MFCELSYHFCKNTNIENPSFYYQSEPIKIDSWRTLRELGIKNMSLIEVETNSYNNNMRLIIHIWKILMKANKKIK